MYYCFKRGRGILEKTPAKNTVFHKECSYKRMLDKCLAVYSEEERNGADFYIADSRGARICNSIILDANGDDLEVEWTLNKYISLSSMKYPSKARFYCVRKGMFL